MQLTRKVAGAVARLRTERKIPGLPRPTRTFALASVVLLMSQCAPTECAPSTPAPATPAPASGHFGWIGVGAALPSDAACAAAVKPVGEHRPSNATPNARTWAANSPTWPRATGAFTGTTDQIIQWAACKWGFDEDVLRAQVAKESWWHQSAVGDFTGDPANCAPGHPLGADGRAGQCPESIGLMQVRTQYYRDAIDGAVTSSAYNLDVALAVWRQCFEGGDTWLNTVERGQDYAAGDAWGCIGRWFSGRWHTAAANTYVADVQSYLNQRIWETANFANG